MHKIAYLIISHSDPENLAEMMLALGPEADYYIHIDAKVDLAQFILAVKSKSAVFVEPRITVSWAAISMIDATLALVRSALATKISYGHLVLLSGACFPIKSPKYIQSFFAESPTREFIKYIDMRDSPGHYMLHVSRRWYKEPYYRGPLRIISLADKGIRRIGNIISPSNNWPINIKPYFGSQWWAITKACAEFLIEELDHRISFYELNRYTFAPDEHFFHTLIGNSEFAQRATGLQLFEGRGTYRLANLHMIHSSLQKFYTLDDWEDIAVASHVIMSPFGAGHFSKQEM